MRGIPVSRLSHSARGALALLAAIMLPLQPFIFAAPSHRQNDLPPLTIDDPAIEEAPVLPAERGDESPRPEARPTPSAPIAQEIVRKRSTRAARGAQVLATALSPDGRYLVSRTSGREIKLIDLETQNEVSLAERGIAGLAFTPDGRSFVTCDADGRVVLWDSVTGRQVREIKDFRNGLHSVAIAPDGSLIAVGGGNLVAVVGLETGEVTELSQPSAVNCVRFSPNGRLLAIAMGDWQSSGGEVRIWDLASNTLGSLHSFESAPGALAFFSDQELIVGLWNGRSSWWNLATETAVAWADAEKNVVTAAAFSQNNPQLLESDFVSAGSEAEFEARPQQVVAPTEITQLFSSPSASEP
jgi:hypothetical protein